MAKTIRTKVYSFSELSDDAKQVAIDNYRNRFDDWYFENQCLADDFNEQIKAEGFENPRVKFSLSCSQGDGLSFSADGYNGLYGIVLGVVGKHKPKTAQLITDNITLNIRGNIGRYCYASINDIEGYIENYTACANNPTPNIDNVVSEVVDELADKYIDLCSELENQGYTHYEYIMSDEAIAETLEANGYLFTKDGREFNY